MHSHHESAQSILNLLRGRSKAEDIIAHLETLRSSLNEAYDNEINVDSVIRSIAVQSLLHVGSRSFSHFLNAIERYLPLLRSLSSGSDAKSDILTAVGEFWRRNKQMVVIVFDKLMQYQIVDPSDVVGWAFHGNGADGTVDVFKWELIKGALDKANGRVAIAKKKVVTLRKEQDDDRARAKASGGNVGTMEVDAETGPGTNLSTPLIQ